MKQDWIGYQWLAKEFDLAPVQPFATISCVGRSGGESPSADQTVRTFSEASRPAPTLAAHLAFALKYEGVHLEFLARLFTVMELSELEEWLRREPSGRYARRAGFLYEWFTGRTLDYPGASVGNYVLALPSEDYFTRTEPINVPRWRVRNNLPGTARYCPTVRRTEVLAAYDGYDCRDALEELELEYGADILNRSAVWLTVKESRASFAIEHEDSQSNRVKRFAAALERYVGTEQDPLFPEFLAKIQAEILGERTLRVGLRRSPVFVGETSYSGEHVHYVAPSWEFIGAYLDGLREFAASTGTQSSVVRAAVLSFGFVFIHPMTDGNGRISRFLVNDTLRRDGAVPSPYVLPISATITQNSTRLAEYDRALETYSRPFMRRYSDACRFGGEQVCPDGVRTNFHFSADQDAQFVWAFPDLTAQAEYLAAVIRETIESEVRQEAQYLSTHRKTRARVKEVIEAPDLDIDRMIRSVRQNRAVSGKLTAEFPLLADPEVAQALLDAIRDASE